MQNRREFRARRPARSKERKNNLRRKKEADAADFFMKDSGPRWRIGGRRSSDAADADF